MSNTRDTQMTRLYRTEQQFRDAHERWDKLHSVEEFTRLFEAITDSGWWQDNIGIKPTIRVSGRLFRSAGVTSKNQLIVGSNPKASWSWRKLVLTHELAHVAHSTTDPHHREPAHGPTFAQWHLVLVENILGANAMETLKRYYTLGGVRHRTELARHIDKIKSPLLPWMDEVTDRTEFAKRRESVLEAARVSRRASATAALRLTT